MSSLSRVLLPHITTRTSRVLSSRTFSSLCRAISNSSTASNFSVSTSTIYSSNNIYLRSSFAPVTIPSMKMSSNPTIEAKERQEARVYSAEKLMSHKYKAAEGNTFTGATTTVTVADAAQADVTLVFVTKGQIKAGASFCAGLPVKCADFTVAALEAQHFKGDLKSTAWVPGKDSKVLLVGLGDVIDGVSSAQHYLSTDQVRQAVHAGVETAKAQKPSSIAVIAPTLPVNAFDAVEVGCGDGVKAEKVEDAPVTPLGTPVDAVSNAELVGLVIRTAVLANHTFDKYLKETSHVVANFTVVAPAVDAAVIADNVMVAESVMVAREVGNDRADAVTPAYMQAMAELLAAAHPDVINVRTLQYDELVANGYNLITAVGQAAEVKPRIVAIEFTNAKIERPIALVGKGVTYDTGGLNLKPTGFMEDMHMDMCGSAATLATMRYLASARPAKRVVGILALAENAIDALSYKPHAVIATHIGSVQIGNTDAEGRLCLADAMTFVQTNYNPTHVVDIATLTGACVVALGEYAAGLFTNSSKLAAELQDASHSGYERLWRLPILREHQAELKGDQSDFSSTGKGRYGGASTAAAFLEKYIKPGVAWAHVDVAGAASYSAKRDYMPKGATGFPVQTLINFAKNH